MRRERLVSAYPGRRRVGLVCLVVDDRQIRKVAHGSIESSAVSGLLSVFRPDRLLVEAGREEGPAAAPFRTPEAEIQFVHPGWRSEPGRQIFGRVGALAHNAWRMGLHDFVRRGPYRVGRLEVSTLTREWIERNSPRRLP